MKYEFKRKPRPYQVKALKKMMERKNLAVWFDPGLGKTKVAIDYSNIAHYRDSVSRILVICPLSAMGVWEDEWPVDSPTEMATHPLYQDTIADRAKAMWEIANNAKHTVRPHVVIVTYPSLTLKREKGKYVDNDVIKAIKSWGPQLIIIDEAHYIKNYVSIRSKAIQRIKKYAVDPHVMELTGTPFPKNILDAFGQYLVLDPTVFGESFPKFRDRYAVCHPLYRSKVIGWTHQDEFEKKIHSAAIRVKDTEAKHLSPLTIQDIPVYLSNKTKEIYKSMAKDLIAEIEGEEVSAVMAADKVGKLQQITGGFMMKIHKELVDDEVVKTRKIYPIGREKIDVMMDLIDRYIENEQMIIGCKYIYEVASVEKALTEAKIPFRTIRGGVSGQERAEIQREYQSHKIKVVVFQVSAATAMTLTAGSVGILFSCTSKWDDYWQWLKRLHRDGQTKHVRIYRLIAKGTVDVKVIRNIEEKRDFTSTVVDKSKFRDFITPNF